MGRGEIDNERPFYIKNSFRTKAMNYRVQFTNAPADVEITSLQILDETIGGVPPQDQVRFVLHSNQFDKLILAEFERVIQSNKEFRLNDTVEINVMHVSMPIGGKGNKRSEVNLEKHLEKKRPIIRIRNEDDLCMAQALVVAKAKLDNDPRDRQIRDHRKPT